MRTIISPVIAKAAGSRFYASYDSDARDYFIRAESLGGRFASGGYTEIVTKAAISQWFTATKDLGVYSKVVEAYLFVGPTFSGMLAKLKHSGTATLTNNNFVSGD